MNLLLRLLGLACLVVFAVLWLPGAFLIAGLVLLLLAEIRRANRRIAAMKMKEDR